MFRTSGRTSTSLTNTSRSVLAALALLLAGADTPARREVAVTFDDLPATHGGIETYRETTRRLLHTVTSNRIPAIGFVNEQKLYVDGKLDEERVAVLRSWVEAGLELGNHTWSHVPIDRVSIERYKQEVILGEVVSRELLAGKGKRLRYFRHTQLRTGPTAQYRQELNSFLAQRGYIVAPVTIDNNEYIFADVYSRARQRGDGGTMKRVAEAYVPYMEQVFAHFEALSRESLGYEVKQTLLLHANELNADYFDELVAMMRKRGYRFISLEEALKDPAYRRPEAQSTRGLSWLHRWMLARGATMKPEPQEPPFIRRLFDEYRS